MSSVLDEVVGVIGQKAANELTERLGGIPINIPHSPDMNSMVVLAIGKDAAIKLCAAFGGTRLQLPSKASLAARSRKRAIEADIRSGMSHRDIAQQHGVTLQWVDKVSAQMRKTA